jgi:hypothetical protein
MYYGANNHGGLVQIGDAYYIFYHRHTDGTNYSRQGMAERVQLLPGGRSRSWKDLLRTHRRPAAGKWDLSRLYGQQPVYPGKNMYNGGSGSNGFWLDGRFRASPRRPGRGRGARYIMNMTEPPPAASSTLIAGRQAHHPARPGICGRILFGQDRLGRACVGRVQLNLPISGRIYRRGSHSRRHTGPLPDLPWQRQRRFAVLYAGIRRAATMPGQGGNTR